MWVSWGVGQVQQGRVRSHRAHGCMRACITRASLCQCAGNSLRFAAPRSGVLSRLATIRGSFGRSLRAAHSGANHAARLRSVRLHQPVEQNLTGLADLVPLSLYIPGRTTGLAMLQAISSTQTNVPIVSLHQSAPAMPLQQPIWLLHFCATCGQCT